MRLSNTTYSKSLFGIFFFVFTICVYWWAAVATSQAEELIQLNATVDKIGLDSIIISNNDNFDYTDLSILVSPVTQLDSSYNSTALLLPSGQVDTFHLHNFKNFNNLNYPNDIQAKTVQLTVFVPNTDVETYGYLSIEF